MDNTIQKLKDSLIYQMSLGGRELFHSNVWSWLMTQDPVFISVFFPTFDANRWGIKAIKREQMNMDLTIELAAKDGSENQGLYIIENKLKSLPYAEQLNNYTKKAQEQGFHILGKVYTGLRDTLTQTERKDWRFVGYSELANGIAEKNESCLLSETQKAQIREYCANIHCIDKIITQELEKNNDRLVYPNRAELNDTAVRLQDICVKLKGADFADYLRKELRDSSLKIGLSFNRKNATIDIHEFRSESDSAPVLGVQIEETQYRRFAHLKTNNVTGITMDALFEQFADAGWFDRNYDNSRHPKTLFGHPTSMSPKNGKQYDSYKKDGESCLVYQYHNIGDGNNLYSDLTKEIQNDLIQIRSITEAFH